MYKNVYFITKEEDENVISKIFDYIKEKYCSEISIFSEDKIFEDSQSSEDSLFFYI